ncbi:MAG: hypothetical protein GXP27_18835 [Planctomycetes bacterium]|nr:hypothetical protein [Planctomycetota bacterium]
MKRKQVSKRKVVWGVFISGLLLGVNAFGESPRTGSRHLQISGIYPHLAVFNQPQNPKDRPNHGECGIGAIAPWAGRLWYITYPQHKTTGSNDKLYELDEQLNVTIRPESVGGTHACRMIHRESNQLIIGPYFIDPQRRVRAVDLQELRGRMTAVMRHLTDPANRVYFYDMEGAIYEVDVHSLAVRKLFEKPVPGWHGKGGYTSQRRVVIANNGERGGRPGTKHALVGGPPRGEEAGILAEWDGRQWRIVERKQFCDVTGPGGIHGAPTVDSPLWAIGWDRRSVILKLLDHGRWSTFRLPKASHSYDPRHGWFTEWPRIRHIAPKRAALCMHGTLFEFPVGFRASETAGIRPLCTHLRVIPDFCHWRGRVVLGADDAAMMGNPLCGQAQSNLWFGTIEELRRFGPPLGWGGVWRNDAVQARRPSAPYLFAGYDQRVVHLAHDADRPVTFRFEVDRDGHGHWQPAAEVTVPPHGYGFRVFPENQTGEWIRVTADRACRATAYFHYASLRDLPDRQARQAASLFDSLARAEMPARYVGGLIRPAAHNRSLQWLQQAVDEHGRVALERYVEVDLDGATDLVFRPGDIAKADVVRRIAAVPCDFAVDSASVVVTDRRGRRFRLPKGSKAFDQPFPTGWPRGIRECVTERFLANLHGTFYEVPRAGYDAVPDFSRMKPVCSHDKLITDFCSWRGLLVLAGTRLRSLEDGHFFGDRDGRGLWFGAIDDLWKLGKPVGRGGPWMNSLVQPGQPSDPYLMTGYDRKRLQLWHDARTAVTFTIGVDFDHNGFHVYRRITVPAGEKVMHRFPDGFQAHWVRLTADSTCHATAEFLYE